MVPTNPTGDILLVGSVPFDSVDAVMTTCAAQLGDRLYAMPDGEVGARSLWIMSLPQLTYAHHADLLAVRAVAPEDVKNPPSHDPELVRKTFATFRLRPGVTDTSLELHYAPAAIESYGLFRRLRDAGTIAEGVRFMVALPCTDDATRFFFPDRADRQIMARAYERGLQQTVAQILEHVPADDLVIQLDYCTEVLAIVGTPGRAAQRTFEERLAELTSPEYLAPMTATIPDEVELGYHVCFGTWGGWPIGEVDDIGPVVQMANAMVANTPRRVDFVHLPAMPGADDAYFRPLAALNVGDARVFLGVELGDGVDAMCRRAELARRYLPSFGYAHFCGYGRDEPSAVPAMLADLRAGAERLSS